MIPRSTSFLAILALALLGCGGLSDSKPDVGDERSADAFLGRWSGSYSQDAPAGRQGSMVIEITRTDASNGYVAIEGTAEDAREGSARVGGTIYDREPAQRSQFALLFADGNGVVFKGRPSIDSRGHLVGPIYDDLGDGEVETQLDLAPVAP